MNRSSAWSPLQLAIATTVTTKAVKKAIDVSASAFEGPDVTDEQRAEAIQMVAQGVLDGVANSFENLKWQIL